MTIYLLTRIFAWLYMIPWPLSEEALRTLFIISMVVAPFEIIGIAALLQFLYTKSKNGK